MANNSNKVGNYFDAVHYLGGDFILLNNIHELDPDFCCSEQLGDWVDPDTITEDNPDGYPVEIYQYFITNLNYSDVEYLANRFGLLFQYSDLLEYWVLCVPHFGTMWKGVPVVDNLENM